jgi:hypothetical protein
MRLTAVLLALACLAACGGVQTVSEHSPARDDEWRQRQAELDAQASLPPRFRPTAQKAKGLVARLRAAWRRE